MRVLCAKRIMELFRIEHISRQFSDKFVLRNFSLTVSAGEKLNIAGRSGIGKTTLFRLLLGFVTPDSGTIRFGGKELNDETMWQVRQQVAYVSQDLQIGRGGVAQLFDDTMNLKANRPLKKEAERLLPQLLRTFQLADSILDKSLESLSGGERQRVAIINALLLQRRIFFLDEVTSALDPDLKALVLDYFLGNPDFTVLYISHDRYVPVHSTVKTIALDAHE